LWIAANGYGIVRISDLSAATPKQEVVAPPHADEVVRDITVGPDGNVWYANYNYASSAGSSVGRVVYGAAGVSSSTKRITQR
jgi:hypothetical protein